jgi:hypothetical protein
VHRAPAVAACLIVASGLLAACVPTQASPTGLGVDTPVPASESPTDPASSAPIATQVGPSTSPATPPASSEPGSSPSAGCSGTDNNRDFFAAIAEAVEWDVYCAVLPAGWFVDGGTYRLPAGGWLDVTYRGPADGRLTLREGAFCTEDGDCVPSGTDVGAAPFGDREGTLVAADDGTWSIAVDRGAEIAWLATGSGLDEGTFRGFAERLVRVRH